MGRLATDNSFAHAVRRTGHCTTVSASTQVWERSIASMFRSRKALIALDVPQRESS
jgi:hypothetical protein